MRLRGSFGSTNIMLQDPSQVSPHVVALRVVVYLHKAWFPSLYQNLCVLYLIQLLS